MKKRHKTLFVKPPASTNSDINVTPLVDVVLVLLIIFMVVTPLLEKDIPVRTPDSEKVEQVQEIPPDQLIVYVRKYGDVKINSESVPEQDFVAKLKFRLDPKPAADKAVFIVAEDNCNYGKFVHVLDNTRAAGAETLGFAPDTPDPALFL